jgi:hypothetical protein
MNLKVDPFPIVFARGDETTKLACLEFFGLRDSRQAKTYLLELIKRQRPDGAFPSGFDAENWGMLDTARNTLLLLGVGMPPQGVNVDSGVRFILSHQRPDGGWSENPAVKTPPERTWLSAERSITWLSADIVDLLHQVGMGERPECQAAVRWLRATQNPHGGWPSLAPAAGDQPGGTGDPDASAQITFLMGELYGVDDPTYLKGRALFEDHLDECARDVERGYRIRPRDGEREQPEVYHLTHLLVSWLLDPPRRFRNGYDAGDPRVRRMMEALIDIQHQDGGWRPFWVEESSPLYTLLAVRALILSGMLTREDLEANVRTYAD